MNQGRVPRGSRYLKNELEFDTPNSVQKMTLSAFHAKAGGGLGAGLKAERAREVGKGQLDQWGSEESSENKAEQQW